MNTSFKQQLKARAHHLKPVILMGAKGLTPALVAETDLALTAHELIKVKLSGVEKENRKEVAEQLTQQLQAELVQIIGTVAVLYRKNPD